MKKRFTSLCWAVAAFYEIEATGTVKLEDGFKVEKGATFAVYPSSF